MRIGAPKEIVSGEKRVALTPESAAKLAKLGLQVLIEAGAGESSGFSDLEYQNSNASMVSGSPTLFQEADIIVKVQKPVFNETIGKDEVLLLPEGKVLIALLQPFTSPDLVKKLLQRKITSFSMDAVPRITRAQRLDALSSMSTIAGYKAVLMAADALPKFFPMLMTAAGTIPPARVFVIGAGVAGLQAIATARRLGAVVEAFDTRPAVKEQVESLGAKFVEVDLNLGESQAQDHGGYAKELSQEFYKKEGELIQQKVREADVVITTALLPGKPAPCLIVEGMVKQMRPGSVVVDLAAEMGGNCELTEPGKEVVKHGVRIFGTLNLPSLLAFHASQMYSRNVLAFLEIILSNHELKLDMKDEIIAQMCITHQGEVINRSVKNLMQSEGIKTSP